MRQYLLSVTAGAIICAVILRLLPGKGTAASMGKMLTGMFLAFTVISPWTKVQLGKLSDFTEELEAGASQAIAEGNAQANSALRQIITEQVTAYIMDKAQDLGAELKIQVEVSRDALPVPVQVRLQGRISPYARGVMEAFLEEDLGIAKEKQVWT